MDTNNNIQHSKPVPPFVRYCSAIIPTAFDDSLSYYEALCALWKWMQDNLVNVINNNANVTEYYIQIVKDLKSYVENYFANLDVQEEINNKLDEMAEDGQLADIISQYLNSTAVFGYDTVADMKSSENLVNGSYARTLGYYAKDDKGGALYKIVQGEYTDDGGSYIELDSGLFAELITNGYLNVKQFGAKGDGETDDTSAIQNALAYAGNGESVVVFESGTYLVSQNLNIYSNTSVNLNGAKIKSKASISFVITKENAGHDGYGALENFVIKNGTLEGEAYHGIHFNIFHGLDCKFENLDLINCFVDTHVFDLGGCKNILIKDCNFIGNLKDASDTANAFREVIQPDYASHSGFPMWDDDGSVDYDGCPTVGLTVDGCVFKKNDGDTFYLNAIGTHAITGQLPHSDILIQNCEFYGNQTSNIRLPYFKNVIIRNNKFYGLSTSRTSGANSAINCNEVGEQTYSSENLTIEGNYYESVNNDDQAFISLTGRSATIIKNVKIYNNTYNGWATGSSSQGQDFVDLGYINYVYIRDNVINQAKQIVFKRAETALNHLFIENNNFNNCLRFLRCADSDTLYEISDFHANDNNVFVDGETPISYNTSNFACVTGFDENYDFTSSSTDDVRLQINTSDLFEVYSNYTIAIPSFVNSFRTGGSIVGTPTTGGEVRIHVRIYDSITNSNVDERMYWVQAEANKKMSIPIPELTYERKDLKAPASTNPTSGRYAVRVDLSFNGSMRIFTWGSAIEVTSL